MKEFIKEAGVTSKGNNSNIGYQQFKRALSLAENRGKSYLAPKPEPDAAFEEMHWMAFAAYHQSK